MRPHRLPSVLEIAMLLLLPSVAWSDNMGATRIPPQVEGARNAPANSAESGSLEIDAAKNMQRPIPLVQVLQDDQRLVCRAHLGARFVLMASRSPSRPRSGLWPGPDGPYFTPIVKLRA